MTDRTKDPNEGLMGRSATPQDQPGEGEADVEGHRFRSRGVLEDAQDTEAEPEVEGHRLLVGPEGRGEPAAEVEGHALRRAIPEDESSEGRGGESKTS